MVRPVVLRFRAEPISTHRTSEPCRWMWSPALSRTRAVRSRRSCSREVERYARCRGRLPPGDVLGGRVEWSALQFHDLPRLRESLQGVETVYNTYWVRFERGGSTFARAVENIGVLLQAARDAGVQNRPRQRGQPVGPIVAAVLPRQGTRGAERLGFRPFARHRSPDARLRGRRHPDDQQHRLDDSSTSILRHRRTGRLPGAAGLGRGRCDVVRRCRRSGRQRDVRRGGA